MEIKIKDTGENVELRKHIASMTPVELVAYMCHFMNEGGHTLLAQGMETPVSIKFNLSIQGSDNKSRVSCTFKMPSIELREAIEWHRREALEKAWHKKHAEEGQND